MLAVFNLVHLNGRVYDPLVGRMMSADPTVPNPLNGQAWNRYSYVGNNPLAFTAPPATAG
jgi:RHS repeat-associated protein